MEYYYYVSAKIYYKDEFDDEMEEYYEFIEHSEKKLFKEDDFKKLVKKRFRQDGFNEEISKIELEWYLTDSDSML